MHQDALPYSAHRVSLALSRRPILPPLAMQYRLCEVGSPRLDPRILERHLGRLCEAREEVVRTAEGFYGVADMASAERCRLSKLAAAALGEVGVMTGTPHVLYEARDALTKALDAERWKVNATPRTSVGSVDAHPTLAFQILRRDGVAPLSVLFSHDGDWLYPDAIDLWSHARQAEVIGAHPVFIARKVAPITYPLLAALNMRALQYFDLLAAGPSTDSQQLLAERLGLPRVRSVASLATHPVLSQIVRLINERPAQNWEPALSEAFSDALRQGFAELGPTPSAIADWAETHQELPSRWVTGIRIWADQRERPLRDVPSRRTKSTQQLGPFGRGTQVTRVPFRV